MRKGRKSTSRKYEHLESQETLREIEKLAIASKQTSTQEWMESSRKYEMVFAQNIHRTSECFERE